MEDVRKKLEKEMLRLKDEVRSLKEGDSDGGKLERVVADVRKRIEEGYYLLLRML